MNLKVGGSRKNLKKLFLERNFVKLLNKLRIRLLLLVEYTDKERHLASHNHI